MRSGLESAEQANFNEMSQPDYLGDEVHHGSNRIMNISDLTTQLPTEMVESMLLLAL
jgi:hypothetical protein